MRTKKVKPPPKKHEYRLFISKLYDEVYKKDYISFRFQTTKEFLTFQYILKIETEVTDNSLIFKLLGFSAPVSELSVSGVAVYEYRFYEFKRGTYSIVIDRKDSTKAKFRLEIINSKAEQVKVSHLSKESFIEVITE